jgi:hypothetical protein
VVTGLLKQFQEHIKESQSDSSHFDASKEERKDALLCAALQMKPLRYLDLTSATKINNNILETQISPIFIENIRKQIHDKSNTPEKRKRIHDKKKIHQRRALL